MDNWILILLVFGFLIIGFYINLNFKQKCNRGMFLSSYFSILREYGYVNDDNLDNYAYTIKYYSNKLAKKLYHDSYKKYINYIDDIAYENINNSTYNTIYYFSHCMIIDAILNMYVYCNESISLEYRYISLFENSIIKIDSSDVMYNSYKLIGLRETRVKIEKAIESTLCYYS